MFEIQIERLTFYRIEFKHNLLHTKHYIEHSIFLFVQDIRLFDLNEKYRKAEYTRQGYTA